MNTVTIKRDYKGIRTITPYWLTRQDMADLNFCLASFSHLIGQNQTIDLLDLAEIILTSYDNCKAKYMAGVMALLYVRIQSEMQ